LSVDVFTDGVRFHSSNRQTTPLVRVEDGHLVAAVMNAAMHRKLEAGSGTSRRRTSSQGSATPVAQHELGPRESLTPGGFVRRADGVVIVPEETKRLIDAWANLGRVEGLTIGEIALRLGFNPDPVPAVSYSNGYAHTWTLPGYTIGVLFGHDNRAIGILGGSEQLG
jgi:hypothetical protein